MLDKIATQNPHYAALVNTNDGRTITKEAAEKAGFKIESGFAHAARLGYKGGAAVAVAKDFDRAAELARMDRKDYLAAVLALPEARDRPVSAAKIAAGYNLRTMPLERAASFLRGLSVETANATGEGPAVAKAITPAVADAMYRRRVEIAMTGLHRKANVGDFDARKKLNSFQYALQIADNSETSLADALTACGINPTTLV